jgi:hypothetical protein
VGGTGVKVRVAVAVGVWVGVAVGVTGVGVRVGVAVGGTGVGVRVAVGVGDGALIVTLLLAPVPGIVAGPTAGGPGMKALTRLVGLVVRLALPEAIVVKDRTATLTSPVGAVVEV